MAYTYKEVFEAYIKLKTYIYHDSTNLFMRKQLAIFETDMMDDVYMLQSQEIYKKIAFNSGISVEPKGASSSYEYKLEVFTAALKNYHRSSLFFDFFLNKMDIKVLPKALVNKRSESKIISNKRTRVRYIVERESVFIDVPIEIHLISVLWILKCGVQLDADLFDNCFGNRLVLNGEKDKVVTGSALFKPYPKQYQKWRDEAVRVARECVDRNKSIIILNLDVRDFFYSVRLDPARTKISDDISRSQGTINLYSIFERIHQDFTQKLLLYNIPNSITSEVLDSDGKLDSYVLPIGLLSSFVLANDYLKDFDKRIISHSRPEYYGRYVDDILMVIADPILPHDNDHDSIGKLNFDFDSYLAWVNGGTVGKLSSNIFVFGEDEKLTANEFDDSFSDVEKFVLINFDPIISVIDKPPFLRSAKSDQPERVFKLNGYKRLYCQSGKTLLYYFDKDESTLVIDKLKRELEEKSSEFRNYNDEEDFEEFESSAYHLLYDGIDGSDRTLKGYNEDRFGLSIYLSKKIFSSLRRDDKISTEEVDKVITFFKGENALNLYTLWERVFVFLLVNRQPEAFIQFYINCRDAILRMDFQNKNRNVGFSGHLLDALEYLENACGLSLSLCPRFLHGLKGLELKYYASISAQDKEFMIPSRNYHPTDLNQRVVNMYRKSNLVRHHYTAQPLLSYLLQGRNSNADFTTLKIPLNVSNR